MILYVLYEAKTLSGGFGHSVGASIIIGQYRSLEEAKNAVNEQIKLNPNGYFTLCDVYNNNIVFDTAYGWKE